MKETGRKTGMPLFQTLMNCFFFTEAFCLQILRPLHKIQDFSRHFLQSKQCALHKTKDEQPF